MSLRKPKHHIMKSMTMTMTKKELELESESKRYGLVSYKELPEYMKDNEFMLSHYRVNWPIREALYSVFRWHNETLNVWTHLLGFILFVGLTLANFVQLADLLAFLRFSSFPVNATTSSLPHNSITLFMGTSNYTDLLKLSQTHTTILSETVIGAATASRWPFHVFVGGSMFCLLSSTLCHLLSCHSHPLNTLLLRLDYAGITFMIITSFFPPIFYVFQCDPIWQLTYLSAITALGLATVAALLSPTLSSPRFRSLRALLFVSMGLFGLVPAGHAMAVNWDNPRRYATVVYEVVMAASYLTGTVFYVTRVPERWRPGRFDLVGHSHQIFHVFVIFGALAHYGAALVFLDYRDATGCERVGSGLGLS